MATSPQYYDVAVQMGNDLGWDPLLMYAQMQIETAHFASPEFRLDNNPAGITWTGNPADTPGGTKGRARPANEGGYYVHYDNLQDGFKGYENFIKANSRYSNVKTGKTAADQAHLLAYDGWAGSTQADYAKYESTLDSVMQQDMVGGAIGGLSKFVPGLTSLANAFTGGSPSDSTASYDVSFLFTKLDTAMKTTPTWSDPLSLKGTAIRATVIFVGIILILFALVEIGGDAWMSAKKVI